MELWQIIECKKQAYSYMPEKPELQKYAPVWNQLQVQGSRLVKISPAHSDPASKVQVVLQSMVPKDLEEQHNISTGGHLGVQKLQGKVKDCFYWPGWFGDVKVWFKECVDCASHKVSGRQSCAPLQPSAPSRPFEQVALDILGRLPETPSGNKYILVAGDYFSKWAEWAFLLPIRNHAPLPKV